MSFGAETSEQADTLSFPPASLRVSRFDSSFDASGGSNDDSSLPGDGGAGDRREVGPPENAVGQIPPHERWELNFTASGFDQYDRQLLTRAKVELEGREVIKFIPHSLEKELAEIELEYARASGHTDVAEIAKTVFLSESTVSPQESTLAPAETKGVRFRFRVVSQRYREPGS